ncbi:hypothetical protein [Streptomyces sp. NPDC059009]|uniref:hypothetical protein n=1 Tax=Streptomyces sp. NPDC059009 TaxID=3346694 RepID=UPI0036780A2F
MRLRTTTETADVCSVARPAAEAAPEHEGVLGRGPGAAGARSVTTPPDGGARLPAAAVRTAPRSGRPRSVATP